MKPNFEQYSIHESNVRRVIHINNQYGASFIINQFATHEEVRKTLGCSRSTAYRYMHQLAQFDVEDRRGGLIRRYTVVKRSDLAALQRIAAGNPRFTDPAYQRDLARRPRKKKVDK